MTSKVHKKAHKSNIIYINSQSFRCHMISYVVFYISKEIKPLTYIRLEQKLVHFNHIIQVKLTRKA